MICVVMVFICINSVSLSGVLWVLCVVQSTNMWAIIIGDETGKLWLANNQKDEVIWLEIFDIGSMVEVYYVNWF